MNQFQQAYTVILLAMTLMAWRRQGYVLTCLWASLLATLAVCLAMDMGLDKDTSRLSMMIVDLTTGVALAMRPGLARIIAAGYAVTVPLYVPAISGLFTRGDENFTVIYIVAALQLGALAVGTFGSNGGGGSRRRFANPVSMAIPQRGAAMAGGPISSNHCNGQE
jgi:hypothetical protein